MSTDVVHHDFMAGRDRIERCSICRRTRLKGGMAFPRFAACSPSAMRVSQLEAELYDILHTPSEGSTNAELAGDTRRATRPIAYHGARGTRAC